MANLKWEQVDGTICVHRAKVLGGWLVIAQCDGTGLTFVPDPNYTWN